MRPAKKRRLLEGEIARKGTVIGAGGGRRQLVVTQDNSGGLARAGGSVTGLKSVLTAYKSIAWTSSINASICRKQKTPFSTCIVAIAAKRYLRRFPMSACGSARIIQGFTTEIMATLVVAQKDCIATTPTCTTWYGRAEIGENLILSNLWDALPATTWITAHRL